VSYQVPMQVRTKRQQSLAFRWILAAARGKKGKPMAIRLSNEFMDAFRKEGAAMTTRENVHRMAEANKAFAHFAW
jgi:small subunit ribosomal protein S7